MSNFRKKFKVQAVCFLMLFTVYFIFTSDTRAHLNHNETHDVTPNSGHCGRGGFHCGDGCAAHNNIYGNLCYDWVNRIYLGSSQVGCTGVGKKYYFSSWWYSCIETAPHPNTSGPEWREWSFTTNVLPGNPGPSCPNCWGSRAWHPDEPSNFSPSRPHYVPSGVSTGSYARLTFKPGHFHCKKDCSPSACSLAGYPNTTPPNCNTGCKKYNLTIDVEQSGCDLYSDCIPKTSSDSPYPLTHPNIKPPGQAGGPPACLPCETYDMKSSPGGCMWYSNCRAKVSADSPYTSQSSSTPSFPHTYPNRTAPTCNACNQVYSRNDSDGCAFYSGCIGDSAPDNIHTTTTDPAVTPGCNSPCEKTTSVTQNSCTWYSACTTDCTVPTCKTTSGNKLYTAQPLLSSCSNAPCKHQDELLFNTCLLRTACHDNHPPDSLHVHTIAPSPACANCEHYKTKTVGSCTFFSGCQNNPAPSGYAIKDPNKNIIPTCSTNNPCQTADFTIIPPSVVNTSPLTTVVTTMDCKWWTNCMPITHTTTPSTGGVSWTVADPGCGGCNPNETRNITTPYGICKVHSPCKQLTLTGAPFTAPLLGNHTIIDPAFPNFIAPTNCPTTTCQYYKTITLNTTTSGGTCDMYSNCITKPQDPTKKCDPDECLVNIQPVCNSVTGNWDYFCDVLMPTLEPVCPLCPTGEILKATVINSTGGPSRAPSPGSQGCKYEIISDTYTCQTGQIVSAPPNCKSKWSACPIGEPPTPVHCGRCERRKTYGSGCHSTYSCIVVSPDIGAEKSTCKPICNKNTTTNMSVPPKCGSLCTAKNRDLTKGIIGWDNKNAQFVTCKKEDCVAVNDPYKDCVKQKCGPPGALFPKEDEPYPGCIPQLCTQIFDDVGNNKQLPYQNCIQQNCTSDDITPYEGCLNPPATAPTTNDCHAKKVLSYGYDASGRMIDNNGNLIYTFTDPKGDVMQWVYPGFTNRIIGCSEVIINNIVSTQLNSVQSQIGKFISAFLVLYITFFGIQIALKNFKW